MAKPKLTVKNGNKDELDKRLVQAIFSPYQDQNLDLEKHFLQFKPKPKLTIISTEKTATET